MNQNNLRVIENILSFISFNLKFFLDFSIFEIPQIFNLLLIIDLGKKFLFIGRKQQILKPGRELILRFCLLTLARFELCKWDTFDPNILECHIIFIIHGLLMRLSQKIDPNISAAAKVWGDAKFLLGGALLVNVKNG
jgi:hypothetical protein